MHTTQSNPNWTRCSVHAPQFATWAVTLNGIYTECRICSRRRTCYQSKIQETTRGGLCRVTRDATSLLLADLFLDYLVCDVVEKQEKCPKLKAKVMIVHFSRVSHTCFPLMLVHCHRGRSPVAFPARLNLACKLTGACLYERLTCKTLCRKKDRGTRSRELAPLCPPTTFTRLHLKPGGLVNNNTPHSHF